MAITESLNIIVDANTTQAKEKLSGLKSMVGGLTIFGGGAFLKDAVDKWKEQETAVSKLDTAVNLHKKNMQGFTSKNLQDMASQTQAMTTYGDEATLVADENYLTFGFTAKQIKSVQNATMDLTAHQKGMNAEGSDFLDISNQIGKAVMNSANAMTRNGTITKEQAREIDKIHDKNLRMVALTKAIEENYGGMAQNLAKTDAGKLQQTMNKFGDKMEEIGAKVMPFVLKFTEFLDKNLDTVINIGVAFAGWKIASTVMSGIKGISGSLQTLSAEATTIGAKGVGGNITSKIGSATSKIAKGVGIAGGVAGVVGANQVGGWGGAVSGAVSGATAGAEIGSIVPGIGTAVGAGAGAVIGGVVGGWDLISHNILHLDGKEVAKNQNRQRVPVSGNINVSH